MVHKQHTYTATYTALPMCEDWPVQGGIADRKKGDYKSSVYLMMVAIGQNM
jgi:hypothetical protein